MAKVIEFKSKHERDSEELQRLLAQEKQAVDDFNSESMRFETKYRNGKKITEEDVRQLFSGLSQMKECYRQTEDLVAAMGEVGEEDLNITTD